MGGIRCGFSGGRLGCADWRMFSSRLSTCRSCGPRWSWLCTGRLLHRILGCYLLVWIGFVSVVAVFVSLGMLSESADCSRLGLAGIVLALLDSIDCSLLELRRFAGGGFESGARMSGWWAAIWTHRIVGIASICRFSLLVHGLMCGRGGHPVGWIVHRILDI